MSQGRQSQLEVGLAPMEGVTDFPLRLWISQTSAPAFMWTPFLRVTASFPGETIPKEYAPELSTLKSVVNYTLVPQIMASDVDHAIRTADLLLTHTEFMDLNCGCPAPTVVGHGAGSSLLASPSVFYEFVHRLSTAVGPGRLSVKMRTGIASSSECLDLVSAVRALPLQQLALHGRTRAERYSGYARWDLIGESSRRALAPVVGSGDITSHASWLERRERAPSVQKFIVGRGALRNPWIFEELRTGRPVSLPCEVLEISITCLALLNLLAHTEPVKLEGLVKDGFFSNCAGTDALAWQKLYSALCHAAVGHWRRPEDWELTRVQLGRVKLIWNYWRSGLPPRFFAPTLLRAPTFQAFVEGLRRLTAEEQDASGKDSFTLEHDPNLDWVYSSDRKRLEESARDAKLIN